MNCEDPWGRPTRLARRYLAFSPVLVTTAGSGLAQAHALQAPEASSVIEAAGAADYTPAVPRVSGCLMSSAFGVMAGSRRRGPAMCPVVFAVNGYWHLVGVALPLSRRARKMILADPNVAGPSRYGRPALYGAVQAEYITGIGSSPASGVSRRAARSLSSSRRQSFFHP